jgi:hypothetical protein
MITGRNEICPCQSGKKYKKCCLGKVPLSPIFENPARGNAQTLLKEVLQETENAPLASVIQLNSILRKKSDRMNQRAIPEFLGLSPEQISEIIYFPFSLDRGPLEFTARDLSNFKSVPIVREATYFLEMIRSAGELKATQKGNLPRAMVREFWEHFYKSEPFSFRPTNEGDCRQIYDLRCFLITCGYIKKRQGKFSLTHKGLRTSDSEQLFRDLFLCSATQFNWGYHDRYSELTLVQRALAFHLLILFQKATDWVLDKELGLIFFNAFPALENEARPFYGEAKDEIVRCFSTRFLHRFAQPFGLIEIEEGIRFSDGSQVRATPFFLENFKLRRE